MRQGISIARLRLDQRQYSSDDSDETSANAGLRITYTAGRQLQVELETGETWSNRQFTDFKEESTGYYINLGYRADF